MRVLVTGAGGFIGRRCVAFLSQQGHEVIAVSSRPREAADLEWRQADLLNPANVRDLVTSTRSTHLLHLAWVTTPGVYWTSVDNLAWTAASLELLRQFHARGGERVVMAGTCAEYDWHQGRCIEHRTPLAPTTVYGASKHALQVVTQAYAKETGLSAAWGRVFFTFGPHEHPGRLVPGVVGSLLARQPALCSAGTQSRDFLFVDDLASAFVALLSSDVRGPVNLASGTAVTVRSLVTGIARLLEGADLLRFGSRPMPAGEPDELVADVGRLTGEVGWRPSFTLAEALAATVRWHREQSENQGRR